MTTYLAAAARDQLDLAQEELYEHLVADMRGHCRACDEREPCRRRHQLTEIILGYGSLPKRRPGQMKHGLRTVGAKSL